jgi:hypothetical protein
LPFAVLAKAIDPSIVDEYAGVVVSSNNRNTASACWQLCGGGSRSVITAAPIGVVIIALICSIELPIVIMAPAVNAHGLQYSTNMFGA